MTIYFTAVKRFDSSDGESWGKFVNWSGLFNLTEVITLDCSLCPSLFLDLVREDWNYIETDVIFHDLFNNLDRVLKRTNQITKKMVLAVYHQPTEDCMNHLTDNRFEFCGYDLLDDHTRISALVNCGGFDKAFSSKDINSSGLISNFKKARDVQERLKKHYPQEHHAQCSIWAMWKMTTV